MIRPFGWLRHETLGCRSASSDALRDHVAGRALARVHARLHPVELREHVVREVERSVGEDVALDPAQHAERRDELVRGGDLLALPPHVVGVQPRDDAHVRSVVADREVVVAERARRFGHLQHARLPV